MLHLSESEAQHGYLKYHATPAASSLRLTFIEWLQENKIMFMDVEPEQQALLIKR